jgi:hypothetical protein
MLEFWHCDDFKSAFQCHHEKWNGCQKVQTSFFSNVGSIEQYGRCTQTENRGVLAVPVFKIKHCFVFLFKRFFENSLGG